VSIYYSSICFLSIVYLSIIIAYASLQTDIIKNRAFHRYYWQPILTISMDKTSMLSLIHQLLLVLIIV